MKRARITKMKLDELAAVDSGAQAIQGTVVLKRKVETPAGTPQQKPKPMTTVEKRSALTTATLGHTHLVYGIDDSAAGTTSEWPSSASDGPSPVPRRRASRFARSDSRATSSHSTPAACR